jgi:hypothetical protein
MQVKIKRLNEKYGYCFCTGTARMPVLVQHDLIEGKGSPVFFFSFFRRSASKVIIIFNVDKKHGVVRGMLNKINDLTGFS